MSNSNNMIIAQSGGPSSAINSSLGGAVMRAMASCKINKVYGALHGLEGLLQRKIIDFAEQITEATDFERMMHTPAMALGTCRFKLSKTPDEDYVKVLEIFKEYGIKYFFYIGGNDSMDTINNLSKYFKANGEEIICVGIPKTVDNDLTETDHTPGFGSAARFVAASIAEIVIDSGAYPQASVTVVEIMGRNAGWLTASSVLARSNGYTAPHLIYLPELPFCPEEFIDKVREKLKEEQHIVIAVSEGVRWKETGAYVSQKDSNVVDSFGHASLGGVAEVLANIVKEEFGVKVRSVEPNIMQRCAIHLASGTDLREARELGAFAVETALKGVSDVMVIIKRISNHPYLVRYDTTDLSNVANHERKVPVEWISDNGTNVTEDMVEYLRPLFRGETAVQYSHGLPRFFRLDHSKLVEPEK